MAATLPSPSSFYIIARIYPGELLTISCAEATKTGSTGVTSSNSSISESRGKANPAQEPTLQKEPIRIWTHSTTSQNMLFSGGLSGDCPLWSTLWRYKRAIPATQTTSPPQVTDSRWCERGPFYTISSSGYGTFNLSLASVLCKKCKLSLSFSLSCNAKWLINRHTQSQTKKTQLCKTSGRSFASVTDGHKVFSQHLQYN